MSHSTLVLFRLIHIVVGVFWAGSIIFLAAFVLPAVTKAGPGGSSVMQQLMTVRKLPVYLMASVFITILSGIGLYWYDSAGFTSKVWLASPQARILGIGAILGIIVAIIGGTVNSPTAARLAKLGAQVQAAGGPPTSEQAAELQRLRNRLTSAVNIAAVMLIVIVACMAVARYI
ncbi:MAG: hypothetical protein JWM95_973 [Gemmatimonadetes bacterium]|nr:hypothetical protein [Gemmatimonadota bacterium]